jgi:hypothetical protein
LRQALAESMPRSRRVSMALSHNSATAVVPTVGTNSRVSIFSRFIIYLFIYLLFICE